MPWTNDLYNYLVGKIIGSASIILECGDVVGELKTAWEAVNEP